MHVHETPGVKVYTYTEEKSGEQKAQKRKPCTYICPDVTAHMAVLAILVEAA